jgi:hypothetical protein
MAINFLNSVDLNQNQLIKAAIESQPNDTAAGTGVDGQLYYDTTLDKVKVWTGTAWESISGDITGVIPSAVNAAKGISVTSQSGPIPVVGLDIVGLTALGAPALDDSLVIYDLSTTTNKKLTIADIIGTSSWKLEGDGANPQTIVNGDTVDFVGDTYITATASSPSANNFKVNFDHNDTTRTDTALPAAGTSPGYSGTFDVVNSVSTNATGHVTAINVNSITLPAELDEKYTLPTAVGEATTQPLSGKIQLTGSTDGIVSTVNFVGTTNRIKVAGAAPVSAVGDITFDLTDDVTIVDNLTVGGVISQIQTGETNTLSSPLDMGGTTGTPAPNKILNVATGIDATDGVNLGQVELLVAGIGVFQGGYNATTDPGVPEISGAANVKLDQGDYFVVSHDGDITFSGTTTTGVNSGALANSTALVLAAANTDVAVGMDVTGTGVPPGITILTVTNSTNFVLSSAITIANTTTLTFSDKVVSVEVGDFIFANADIAAASDPAASEYTIVQSDANIAGAGATDGATEKGVAGFDSASFDVSASGWVQLNSTRNPYGAKVALNNTSPVSRAQTGTPVDQTTFTVNIDDASIFGAGALAANVKVEVLNNVAPLETVYPLVERSGSGSLAIKFTGDVGLDIYQVLLSHI